MGWNEDQDIEERCYLCGRLLKKYNDIGLCEICEKEKEE